MDKFFGGFLYCPLFEDFFGQELANYMWGLSSPEQETVMFIGIGLWMLGISCSMSVLYYYIVNHPRLCHWWGWGIFLVINSIINYKFEEKFCLKRAEAFEQNERFEEYTKLYSDVKGDELNCLYGSV